mgnify:CR=1 FL=1
MRILNKTILSGMLLLQMFAICTQASSLKVNHLKCEELVNPLARRATDCLSSLSSF